MTTHRYILTSAAEDDLRGIIRYTRKQWGDTQVRRYITMLEQGMAPLAAAQGTFTDVSTLYGTACGALRTSPYVLPAA